MRLSVCIITYNHQLFIEQAVTSALEQQTPFPYEVVIGEDASTDTTLSILERLGARYPGRLRIERRGRNLGAQANFLRTLEACRGEFVALLEGDDFWTSEHKLQRQVDFLDANPDASFCFHRTRALNEAFPAQEFVLPPCDPPALSSLEFLLQGRNPVAFGSIVARRDRLFDIDEWLAGLTLGDWPLCLMLGARGQIGYIAEEMSRYRVHPGGSWSRLSPAYRVAYVVQMLVRVRRLLPPNGAAAVDRRAGELASWWGDYIANEEVEIDGIVDELVRMDDPEFLSFFLSKALAKARQIARARHWFEMEARRLKATQHGPKTEVTVQNGET